MALVTTLKSDLIEMFIFPSSDLIKLLYHWSFISSRAKYLNYGTQEAHYEVLGVIPLIQGGI